MKVVVDSTIFQWLSEKRSFLNPVAFALIGEGDILEKSQYTLSWYISGGIPLFLFFDTNGKFEDFLKEYYPEALI